MVMAFVALDLRPDVLIGSSKGFTSSITTEDMLIIIDLIDDIVRLHLESMANFVILGTSLAWMTIFSTIFLVFDHRRLVVGGVVQVS